MKGVEFCRKCGTILVPVKKGRSTYMTCRKCGYKTKKTIKDIKIKTVEKKKKGIIVLEKDITPLPLTEKMCPKCEHIKAYWWMQQTRAADEPPTQFFRCEKCKHVWREYK
jgi:DNA-directed RNA polymerase subunit M